jgi:acyl carrier protein
VHLNGGISRNIEGNSTGKRRVSTSAAINMESGTEPICSTWGNKMEKEAGRSSSARGAMSVRSERVVALLVVGVAASTPLCFAGADTAPRRHATQPQATQPQAAASDKVAPPSDSAIETEIKKIVGNGLGVPIAEVTDNASFVDDLGADSLDTIELVMDFENHFEMEIPDEICEKLTTVRAATAYISSRLHETHP